MKKTKRKMFLIALAIVLVIAVIALVNFSPILFMKPVDTGEILDTGVFAVKNNSNNIFIIEANDGYIAIDAGSDAEKAEKDMAEISIDTAEIKYVFLTHSDYDHMATLEKFPNAQIYMSENELQMLNGDTKRNFFSRNSLPDGINLNRFILLSDGQKLEVGGYMLECIETPGHTPGSMSFLLDERFLFTGDAIMVRNNIMSVHPFTMDKKLAENSIVRLEDALERSQYVFTAHYGYCETDRVEIYH